MVGLRLMVSEDLLSLFPPRQSRLYTPHPEPATVAGPYPHGGVTEDTVALRDATAFVALRKSKQISPWQVLVSSTRESRRAPDPDPGKVPAREMNFVLVGQSPVVGHKITQVIAHGDLYSGSIQWVT